MKRRANLEVEHYFQELVAKGLLKVTKSGRVFNSSGRELGKLVDECKYRSVSFGPRGSNRRIQVHRLVWGTFNGVPEDDTLIINHKDGRPGICKLSNLELCTDTENKLHAYANGLMVSQGLHAEENGLAVFTNAQVRKYRKLYAKGKVTRQEIRERHGVSRTAVAEMLTGKTYSTVG